MESHAFDLIALCEDILDDAEVTAEEVRRLGEWLADHEDARRVWPGEVLAGPLQEVLIDKKITRPELRKIAGLLRRVEKEWVRRQGESVQQAALERAAQAARDIDLSTPVLPLIPVTLRIGSHSDGAVTYDVDLSGPSCDCPDWRGARSHLPRGSLGRCCKHVLDAFGRLRPADGWPGWLGAFLEYGWTTHPAKRWFILPDGAHFTLASVGGNEWADVFARLGDQYQRFSYNVVELRWSYGQCPVASDEIERAILSEARGQAAQPGRRGGVLGRLFGW